MATGYVRVAGVLHPFTGIIQEDCLDEFSDEYTDSIIEMDIEALTFDLSIGDSVTVSYDTDFTDNTPTVTIV